MTARHEAGGAQFTLVNISVMLLMLVMIKLFSETMTPERDMHPEEACFLSLKRNFLHDWFKVREGISGT